MISIKKETPTPDRLKVSELREGHWYNVIDTNTVCYVDYFNRGYVFVFFDEDEETPSCYQDSHITHHEFTRIDSVPNIVITVTK